MGSSKWVISPLRWVVTVASLLRTSLSTLPMQLQVVLSKGLPGVYSRCVDCAIVHYKFQPTAGPELKHKCAVSLRADADCVYKGTGLAPGSGPSLGFFRKLILPNSGGKWHGEEEAKSDNIAPAEPVKLFREAKVPRLVAVSVTL